MKNIIEKTYYLFYSITLHSEKKFQAKMMISLGFTLLCIVIDFSLFLFNLKSFINTSKLIIVGIFAIWAIFFHYYFKLNNRDDKIIEKYENIEKDEKRKIIIMVISIYGGLLIIGTILGIIKNHIY